MNFFYSQGPKSGQKGAKRNKERKIIEQVKQRFKDKTVFGNKIRTFSTKIIILPHA